MSSSYTITFKPNPESMQIGTGSYTIPANKFAFVSAVQGSAAFEVDGNTVLNPTSITAVLYTTAGGGGTTVPSNAYFEGQFSSAAAADTLTIAGNLALTTAAAGLFPFKAGPSQTLNFTGNVASRITGYTRANTESPWSHWVPEGTMITGGRWVASIFPQ